MASWDLVGRISAITGNWAPDLERALPSTELEPLMERSAIPSFSFFFMLGLSATIAALGLIANSAPAIIGAMIIAPLMGPIISLAYGLVSFQWRMISRSFLTISTGAIVVVVFAYVASAIFGLRIAGSEIISRASLCSILALRWLQAEQRRSPIRARALRLQLLESRLPSRWYPLSRYAGSVYLWARRLF